MPCRSSSAMCASAGSLLRPVYPATRIRRTENSNGEPSSSRINRFATGKGYNESANLRNEASKLVA